MCIDIEDHLTELSAFAEEVHMEHMAHGFEMGQMQSEQHAHYQLQKWQFVMSQLASAHIAALADAMST